MDRMDDDFSSFPGFPTEAEDFLFADDSANASAEDQYALSQSTFKGDWQRVVDLYETKPEVQGSVITRSKDTALHMAISDDREEFVEKLVGSIVKNGNENALKMKNNRGETPLHRAATRKSVTMCVCIVNAGQDMGLNLLSFTNERGETPIFTAALYNRKSAFIFLHRAAAEVYPRDREKPFQFLRRTDIDGDTALHSVIWREHFDLAFHMIEMYPDLMGRVNEKGMTPLHVLASKPSAFRSGLSLSWWKKIIYHCVPVDPLKYVPDCILLTTTKSADEAAKPKCLPPDNYLTCWQFLWGCFSVFRKTKDYIWGLAKSSGSQEGKKKGVDPEAPNSSYTNKSIPQNYTTCYELMVFVCLTLFRFSGFEKIVNEIREEKQKHEWSVQILKLFREKYNTTYIADGGNPRLQPVLDPRQQNQRAKNAQNQKGKDGDTEKKTPSEETETYTPSLVEGQKGVIEVVKEILSQLSVTIYDTTSKGKNILQVAVENRQPKVIEKTEGYTPLLVAAQKGVIEVVNEILSQFLVTIYDTTSNGKNILQVAVENRQPRVIETVRKQVKKELKLNLWADLIESVDADENTLLHLAAKYEESMFHPWQSHGTAMQMQWEVKWYEYVKSLSPHHFPSLSNKKDENPEQIFTKGHIKLVKDSGEWLKETSESCSVVAALVAGVSFATSSQVPGGTNSDTGKPTLERRPAFELFAITALIGLCFSVTALIMFLSILTSRKLPRDFKKNLPLKILLGLSSLFVSIASMLISFCAAHFFVLEDRFKTAVFTLYTATCLPVSIYAIVQFPLYMDILKSIITKVPESLPSGHV